MVEVKRNFTNNKLLSKCIKNSLKLRSINKNIKEEKTCSICGPKKEKYHRKREWSTMNNEEYERVGNFSFNLIIYFVYYSNCLYGHFSNKKIIEYSI